jgi:hypothetical protein
LEQCIIRWWKVKPLVEISARRRNCTAGLEHKWYLSERAQRDVGHQAATDDYLQSFGAANAVQSG